MRNDAIARQEHGLPSTRDLLLQRYYLHEEEDVHLRDYWPIILKHRWTVLTFFVIILTTVTIYTVTLPPTYKASATIQVERELPKILSFQDFLSVETSFFDTDYITTQQKLLQSRSLASRVADMLRARGQLVLAGQEPFGSTNTKGGVRAWLKNLFRRQPPTVPQAGSSNPTAEQAATGSPSNFGR
ncbi:MAG: hypothetical protein HY278_03490 [candidate division NC10 bacterium]|nr:hypothetical protein [candidate division NC10 bacterium]